MLTLSPTTRYCPYCYRTTPHQNDICAECGKSAQLPRAVQQGLQQAVTPVMLQVEPKGLLIDVFATALTTIGLLLIGFSAIRVATRPLVFLAPVQTVYDADLDDVEAIPVGVRIDPARPSAHLRGSQNKSAGIPNPLVPSSLVPSSLVPSSLVPSSLVSPKKVTGEETQDNGLVFGFAPHIRQTPAPSPPLQDHYATTYTQ